MPNMHPSQNLAKAQNPVVPIVGWQLPNSYEFTLGVFVGKWITQGTIRATEDAAASEMRAIDQYEWLPGSFFMLHKVVGFCIGHRRAGNGICCDVFELPEQRGRKIF